MSHPHSTDEKKKGAPAPVESVQPNQSEAETDDFKVVEVEGVSKTYCRNLRRSLWYGVQDIFRELTFQGSYSGSLRKEEFEAVQEVSFDMKRGECVALLGPNGAGKSSMLKMMNGILRPNQGSIRIRGRVSALIELGTGFNPVLSGRENVFINSSILGFSREETEAKFDEILEFSEIGEFIDSPVQSYSSGMKVRLGFAVASHLAPDLLLVDEVLAVGDLAFRLKCYDHLQKRVESGMSVIVVSHIVAMMPRFCTRAIVFDKGRVTFDGDIMEGIAEYQKILGIEKAKLKRINEDDFSNPDPLSSPETTGVEEPEIQPEVQVDHARTLDQNGVESDTFSTGDPITLEIAIRSQRDLEQCKMVISLDSASFGIVSTMVSARKEFLFPLESVSRKGLNVFRLHLKKVPLVDGGYSFNVSIYGEGKLSLLEQRHALGAFKILNTNDRRKALKGILTINHSWENCNDREES